MGLARFVDVVDIEAFANDQLVVFFAPDSLPDTKTSHRVPLAVSHEKWPQDGGHFSMIKVRLN